MMPFSPQSDTVWQPTEIPVEPLPGRAAASSPSTVTGAGASVALRYGRAKSRQDIAAALACCTEDFVLETIPFRTRASGRAEVEQDLRLFFEQFPDYEFIATGAAESASSVTLWGRAAMTWSGRVPRGLARPWERLLRMPRRRIEVQAVAVLDLRNGLICRERFFYDMRDFCRQLGLPAWLVGSLLRRAERRRHELVGGAPILRCEHSVLIDAPIDVVFARAFGDVQQLLLASPRWPLPRARKIELVGAPVLREGAIRRVHLSSRHIVDERIDECSAPHRIRYHVMTGWGLPIDTVLAASSGEHALEAQLDGRTLVTWRTWLTPRGAAAAPFVGLLLSTVLAPMQRRFLRAIARGLAGART